MKVISCLPTHCPDLRGYALCLGAFDGVHLGHVSLLKKALSSGKKVAVLLFSEPPSHFFFRDKSPYELTPLRAKLSRFEKDGIAELAVILKSSPHLFGLTPSAFIDGVLLKMAPDLLVCGEDYRFGLGAKGSAKDLMERFPVEVVPLLNDEHGKISTQSIIKAIEDGDLAKANSELGYEYAVEGEVVEGFHNGRKIGFPTANLRLLGAYALPKVGVYAGKAILPKGEWKAIINIGSNPTVGRLKEALLECHLIGFEGDLYGKTLVVSFSRFLRNEQRFPSLEELGQQLAEDKKNAE